MPLERLQIGAVHRRHRPADALAALSQKGPEQGDDVTAALHQPGQLEPHLREEIVELRHQLLAFHQRLWRLVKQPYGTQRLAPLALLIQQVVAEPALAVGTQAGRGLQHQGTLPRLCQAGLHLGQAGGRDTVVQLEGLLPAGADPVQQPGQGMTTRAGRPLQQQVLVGLCQLVELAAKRHYLRTGADQLVIHRRLDLAAARQHGAALSAGPLQQAQQILRIERFLQKVERPLLDRPHRQRNVPMAGDHDDRDLGVQRLHAGQQVHAVHGRHVDVRDQHPWPLIRQQRQRLVGRSRRPGVVAGEPQQVAIGFQHVLVIVHQQHVGRTVSGQQHRWRSPRSDGRPTRQGRPTQIP